MGQKIRDLMTSNVVKLEMGSTVIEAARKMRDEDIGNVLVMSAGKLSGILTDRDIVVRCLAGGQDPKSTPIGEICSKNPVTLSPDADPDEAVRLMSQKSIRRIPIMEGKSPVGILSIGDLALKRDKDSALGRISSAKPNR